MAFEIILDRNLKSNMTLELASQSQKDIIKMERRSTCISERELSITLGEDLPNRVTLDFECITHLLFAVEDGICKEDLIRAISQQSAEKGARTYLVNNCEDFSTALNLLNQENGRRLELFRKQGRGGFLDYNASVDEGSKLPRHFLIIEDIVKILGRSGTEPTEEVAGIEYTFARLIRIGRAQGIHIIIVQSGALKGRISENIYSNLQPIHCKIDQKK